MLSWEPQAIVATRCRGTILGRYDRRANPGSDHTSTMLHCVGLGSGLIDLRDMACVLAKRCKEKLAERVSIPAKSFDHFTPIWADHRQNRVPDGIGFIGLPSALQNLENQMVSYGFAPSIQTNDLQPCHTNQWVLTLGVHGP